VTTWVENPEGGRDRGPVALARAWVEVLVRPRRFFRNGVAPGDQAPGLVFGVAVVLGYLLVRFALSPASIPPWADSQAASAALALLVAGLIVAPAGLHLTAALQTLILIATTRERAGVSETVQVLGYASAPALFAALPFPAVRLLACLYGAVLLAVGLSEVHDVPLWKAAALGALPALFVFGYGFGGVFAFEALTGIAVVGRPPVSA
jgi:hypothetical protein